MKKKFLAFLLLISCYQNTYSMELVAGLFGFGGKRPSGKMSHEEASAKCPRTQSFFYETIGVTEEAFQAMLAETEGRIKSGEFGGYSYWEEFAEEDGGYRGHILQVGDKQVKCGYFQEWTINQLQTTCAELLLPGQRGMLDGRGTFNVVERKTNRRFLDKVDTAALQADAANNGAVFQVASNFNGLECVREDQDPYSQLLESYLFDKTQGPAASLSAFPGTIARCYNRYTKKEINFLSDVPYPPFCVTRGGYLKFNRRITEPTDAQYEQIKVGYQGNTQVTHGLKYKPIGRKDQIVNQVFSAAVDFANTNPRLKHNENAQAWAKRILDASYEGTLRISYIKNKSEIFLTWIGCGVFGNELEWAVDSIERMIGFIQEAGLNVTLVWYLSNESDKHDVVRERLNGLVAATGGEYTTYE